MGSGSIKKIAIIGAESTGKTMLCESLALHFSTLCVPEFAREYFHHSDIYNYSLKDLEIIANKQLEMERNYLLKANKVLFCDTALITLKIWAELEFGYCPEAILEKMKNNPYDFYLITNNEVHWEKDEQRLNKFSRERILELNLAEAKREGVAYSLITGLNEGRLHSALKALEGGL